MGGSLRSLIQHKKKKKKGRRGHGASGEMTPQFETQLKPHRFDSVFHFQLMFQTMLQLPLLVCMQWKIKVPVCRSERQPGEWVIYCQAVTRAVTDTLTVQSLFFYWLMHQFSSRECIKEEAVFHSKHVGKAVVWLTTLTPALLYWECDGEAGCVHTTTPKPKWLKGTQPSIFFTHMLFPQWKFSSAKLLMYSSSRPHKYQIFILQLHWFSF